MSIIFISPKYNVGEKVAGGTLTIYENETMQSLVPLWCYADLQLKTSDGTGQIANPVPIDNNGILSSPVFYDESYANAYYVLRDARGATIRHGYVVPMSWQGGGTPDDPGSPWDGALEGDPFWGYEVVQNFADLANHKIVNRPLFVRTNTAGDRSGGLIVYNEAGSAGDGVLTFASAKSTTRRWRARAREINAGYLLNSNQSNPLNYLEVNHTGLYDIVMDTATVVPVPTAFSSKIIFSANSAMDLAGSNGFDFDIEFRGNSSLSLTNSGNYGSFYIKPDPRIIFNNTFYAKNAEFYNEAIPDESITARGYVRNIMSSIPGFENLPQMVNTFTDASQLGNVHMVGPDCTGTCKPKAQSNGLICFNSPNVDIIGNEGTVFIQNIRSAKNASLWFDTSMSNARYKEVDAKEITGCQIVFGNWWGSGFTPSGGTNVLPAFSHTDGVLGFVFNGTKIRNNTIENLAQPIVLKNGAVFESNTLTGYCVSNNSTTTSNNRVVSVAAFLAGVAAFSNCSIIGNRLSTCYLAMVPEISAEKIQYTNTHIDGNTIVKDVLIIEPNGIGVSNSSFLSSNGVSTIPNDTSIENCSIKGNVSGGENQLLIPLSYIYTFNILNAENFYGHLEVTGEFDYSWTGRVFATETFPPKGLNLEAYNSGQRFIGADQYIASLCMGVWGDPVKYGDQNNGTFVLVDPWIISQGTTTTTYATLDQIKTFLQGGYLSTSGTIFSSVANSLSGSDEYAEANWYSSYLTGTASTYMEIDAQGTTDYGSFLNPDPGDFYRYGGLLNNNSISISDKDIVFPGNNFQQNAMNFVLVTNHGSFNFTILTCVVYTGNSTFPWIGVSYGLTTALSGTGNNSAMLVSETTTPGGRNYAIENPVPKTNFVYYNGDNGNVQVVNCLLCCNCNLSLYRIRE